MEKRIYYLSNTVIPNTKREKNIHVFNVLTQVGVKQLTDFLRTVTAASDLVYCTLVTCDYACYHNALNFEFCFTWYTRFNQHHISALSEILQQMLHFLINVG